MSFDRITIYTVDGTDSTDPTHGNPATLGGYPAEVGKALVAHDPALWKWVPISYPAAAFPMGDSVKVGAAKIIGMIKDTEGPFMLSGLSQGAMVCSFVYNEIRFGSLRDRRSDFVGGIMFGNPARAAGHHVPIAGASMPGGAGIQDFGITQSYGVTNGLLKDCEELWLEFANPGDPVCTITDSAAREQAARVFQFVYEPWAGLDDLAAALASFVTNPAATFQLLGYLVGEGDTSPHVAYDQDYPPVAANAKSAETLGIEWAIERGNFIRANPPVAVTDRSYATPMTATLDGISESCEDWRKQLGYLRRAKPIISFYHNKFDGEPGLQYYGRVAYQDTIKASFPLKNNISSQGVMELRFDHYISEWLRTIPNDPGARKNVVIRVDMFGGKLRWTGLLHHHAVKTRDGVRYMELTFNDDLQYLQFLLGPPNPATPIPLIQFPRVLPIFGPAKWACSVMILINLIRVQGLIDLPDDPFDPDEWSEMITNPWGDWQVHIKANPLPFDDSSLWTVLATRMNPIDSVLADALADAQLSMRWRRCFTDEGESQPGLLFNTQPANGALIFEIVDDSGYYSLLEGTFLAGSIIDGMVRSVVTYVGGGIQDSGVLITDDESLYPDDYYGPGFLGTLSSAPWLVVRDNSWTPMTTSELTWSPATAVSVIVGGDNPAADAAARLIIEITGNVLGYFLLAGFSSAGTIAADIIMPFIVGTLAAWLEWKNTARATNLGWCHLWELYQQGAENNAWSLSAIQALRGGFLATRSQTSHTMAMNGNSWIIPGVHFQVGSRIGSTCRGYDNIIFVNQVEEVIPSWDNSGDGTLSFEVKVGENKAAMSVGERSARLLKKVRDVVNNIGVHMVT